MKILCSKSTITQFRCIQYPVSFLRLKLPFVTRHNFRSDNSIDLCFIESYVVRIVWSVRDIHSQIFYLGIRLAVFRIGSRIRWRISWNIVWVWLHQNTDVRHIAKTYLDCQSWIVCETPDCSDLMSLHLAKRMLGFVAIHRFGQTYPDPMVNDRCICVPNCGHICQNS